MLVVVPDVDKGPRMIRESTNPRGQPSLIYIGGHTDLVCGRCHVVLVRGVNEDTHVGEMLLRCSLCGALNDPTARLAN
jgi:hypothetical protein